MGGKTAAIIDYGAGNLTSVANALRHIGCDSVITDDPRKIACATHVILPGVGAFGWAMDNMRARGMDGVVISAIASGKPFLGICLGLQLLFEESAESPGVRGLGVFEGGVVPFAKGGLKIPHMGWNDLDICAPAPVFAGLPERPYVYFVHSYYVVPRDEGIICAKATYGRDICVAVRRENVTAVQFHPEKSGDAGLAMLKNFVAEEAGECML